jgi:MFS transporter, FHS family, glucose/mannose:H+ symporter
MEPVTLPAPSHHPVSTRALFGVSMTLFTVGLLMGSWGPMIPIYASRTGESRASMGILLGVASGTGFVMVLIGGFLVARFEVRRVMQLGAAVIATGLVGLAFMDTKPQLIIAAALAGAGVALTNLSGNQATSRSGHPSALTHNSIANTIYAFGAVSAPLLIALGAPGPALLVGGAIIALVGAVFLNPLAWKVPHERTTTKRRSGSTMFLVWLFLIGIGGYVALEASIAGWLPTAVIDAGGSSTMGAWASTIFYVAMALGRLSLSLSGTRLRPSKVAVFSTLCVLVVLLASSPFQPYLGLTLAGLFMAPIFSSSAVWLARLTPGDPHPTTWLLLAAQAGGTVVPPLVGYAVQDTSIAFSLILAPIAATSLIAYSVVAVVRRKQIAAVA